MRLTQLLAKKAAAAQQFSWPLDALLVLDARWACRVADLAATVGLEPGRMRELLSAFLVAGAEALGPDAPFNLDFSTDQASLSSDAADDDAYASADTVRLSRLRGSGRWLLDDVGRRLLMVHDVARAAKLAGAMGASLDSPTCSSDASLLQRAVDARQQVRFRYLHPWTGASVGVETVPYDVRRQRDRRGRRAVDTPGPKVTRRVSMCVRRPRSTRLCVTAGP